MHATHSLSSLFRPVPVSNLVPVALRFARVSVVPVAKSVLCDSRKRELATASPSQSCQAFRFIIKRIGRHRVAMPAQGFAEGAFGHSASSPAIFNRVTLARPSPCLGQRGRFFAPAYA